MGQIKGLKAGQRDRRRGLSRSSVPSARQPEAGRWQRFLPQAVGLFFLAVILFAFLWGRDGPVQALGVLH